MYLLKAMALAAALTLPLCPAIAMAQKTVALPGGATSLNEQHGDWMLNCRVKGPAATATIECSVSQQLSDSKSHQRVLGIALSPSGDGAKGALVMPFGLALDKGVTLQIDDGPKTAPQRFHTCLPAGCLVSLDWPAGTVTALRNASKLKTDAFGDNGDPASFTISLNGFGSAFDRAIALTAPAK